MYIFIPTPTAHLRQNPDESELQSVCVCVSKGLSRGLIERITFLSSGTATTLMPFLSP